MTVPKMTAEFGIGPAVGSYATSPASAGPRRAVVPMKGPLMRNTAATAGDRMLAKMTDVGPVPCGPAQFVCWGTGGHEYDYICCDMNERCVLMPDGTPDCAPGPAPGFSHIGLPAGYQGIVA
jgi:hypothetical protein